MYKWSEEHEAITAVVRRFVDEEIRPHLDDLEHNGMPPFDIIRKLYDVFGLKEMAKENFKRQLERKISGEEAPRSSRGSDPAAQLISTIELCRVSPGLVTSMGVSSGLAAGTINKLGTPAQMERWGLDLLTFDKVGAWAITEPDSGSDALGGMRTTAKRDREAMLAAAGLHVPGMPPGLIFSLAFLSGPQASMVQVLERPQTIIGREEGDVVTRDPETSRRHALVEIHRDGTVWISDQQSTNGTLVDDERITGPVQIFSQQEFTCGNSTFMLLVRNTDEFPLH